MAITRLALQRPAAHRPWMSARTCRSAGPAWLLVRTTIELPVLPSPHSLSRASPAATDADPLPSIVRHLGCDIHVLHRFTHLQISVIITSQYETLWFWTGRGSFAYRVPRANARPRRPEVAHPMLYRLPSCKHHTTLLCAPSDPCTMEAISPNFSGDFTRG